MEEIIIRPAALKDIETLLRFEQGVLNAERPFDPTLKTDTYYYNLEEMIKAPHIQLLVAELDGELIGSGYARIENAKHFEKHEQHAFLGFMYTDPNHRGKGVNQKIIEGLKEWTVSHGVTECMLQVYTENASAIRAYEKTGFKSVLVEMRMSIL